jgi:cell wall-associated NlpC family hydrolase
MPMVLGYAYCNVAVMPVRAEPYHSAEQTTQMLLGEKAEITQINNRDWAKIRCAWDDYEGWCKLSQLCTLQVDEYRKKTKYIAGYEGGTVIYNHGTQYLNPGTELLGMKGGEMKIGAETGKYKGHKQNILKTAPTAEALRAAAMCYLHAPYQWGGRSLSGIDCSGLSQMVYKLCNHRILRDASQQATQGQLVDFLVHARCGDLAFFEEREGAINHVGILLDNETIIHATDTSGRVVIDKIDQGGIISLWLKKRTHNLRMVRRMVDW